MEDYNIISIKKPDANMTEWFYFKILCVLSSVNFYKFLHLFKNKFWFFVCVLVKIKLQTLPEIELACYRVGLLLELLNKL